MTFTRGGGVGYCIFEASWRSPGEAEIEPFSDFGGLHLISGAFYVISGAFHVPPRGPEISAKSTF